MPSLCLFPLSLPRRSLHESVSQQKKKSWRSVSLLIKYIWLSLEKKLSPTTKLMSVFLCSSKVLFFQKARIQHKFQTNQVFKVLLSMINNFFNLFESWSLTLKILPCSPVELSHLSSHSAQNRDAAPEKAQRPLLTPRSCCHPLPSTPD